MTTNTKLDTMNMLAESTSKPDMDTFADIVPNRSTPPPPPAPPEGRLMCGTCGYTASESVYRKNHKYCSLGLVMIAIAAISIAGMILLPLAMQIYSLF